MKMKALKTKMMKYIHNFDGFANVEEDKQRINNNGV